MGCFFPVGTYRKDGSATLRPCGGCIGCRLEYSRQWAIRAINESQLHEENCFLTLTFNNENLPVDNSVTKRELQSFIKELRRQIEPKRIRYLGCGEYGDAGDRPHYHVCLFGHEFPDKKVIYLDPKKAFGKKFKRGHDHTLYRSSELERLWTKGFSSIGELTFESAAYVARYVMKKIKLSPTQQKVLGLKVEDYYKNREPPFALMSRRPGLGSDWIKKYLRDVYPKDFIVINGKKMQPPRFYDTVFEKLHPEEFNKLKEERLLKQLKNDDEGLSVRKQTGLRMIQKKRHKEKSITQLQRSLHYDRTR